MIQLFSKLFNSRPAVEQDQEATLDHVEVPDPCKAAERRAARKQAKALERAAAKYGKPWKCGPASQAREVFVKQERAIAVEVKGQDPAPPANVKQLKRGAR